MFIEILRCFSWFDFESKKEGSSRGECLGKEVDLRHEHAKAL